MRAAENHTLLDVHSLFCRPVTSMWISRIASCCAETVFSLEKWIFCVLEFHCLKHSNFKIKFKFQRMFNDIHTQRDIVKVLGENF